MLTVPQDSLLSPHPGFLFLCVSDPLIAHPSLPGSFVQTVPGGRWAGHESQDFCILSSAAGRISEWPCMQLSLTAHRLCCDPVRSSDWRSLCRAGMRLNPKDQHLTLRTSYTCFQSPIRECCLFGRPVQTHQQGNWSRLFCLESLCSLHNCVNVNPIILASTRAVLNTLILPPSQQAAGLSSSWLQSKPSQPCPLSRCSVRRETGKKDFSYNTFIHPFSFMILFSRLGQKSHSKISRKLKYLLHVRACGHFL